MTEKETLLDLLNKIEHGGDIERELATEQLMPLAIPILKSWLDGDPVGVINEHVKQSITRTLLDYGVIIQHTLASVTLAELQKMQQNQTAKEVVMEKAGVEYVIPKSPNDLTAMTMIENMRGMFDGIMDAMRQQNTAHEMVVQRLVTAVVCNQLVTMEPTVKEEDPTSRLISILINKGNNVVFSRRDNQYEAEANIFGKTTTELGSTPAIALERLAKNLQKEGA